MDLFAGIGGFHTAIKNVSKRNGFKAKCVLASEIDQKAILTYKANHKVKNNDILNIRNINIGDIEDFDVLFGGFPCQTFSNAGKKLGFLDETRGTLFFDIVSILKEKKPKYILLENVKHLVNHDNGQTWEIINNTLKEIGYIIPKDPLILNPINFNVPQDRPRVFIPGVLKEKSNYQHEFLELNIDSKKVPLKENAWKHFLEKDIDAKYLLNKETDKYLINCFNAWDEFIKNIITPNNTTIPVVWTYEFGKEYDVSHFAKWKQNYILKMRDLYSKNKEFIDKWLKKWNVEHWNKREQKFEWQAGKDNKDIKNSFIQLRQSGIRCKRKLNFPTLVAMVQIPILYDGRYNAWRYLTPRECANIQSFPKSFHTHSDISNDSRSDYYSYKQFGNAINVKVVEAVLEELLKVK
nr:DNA (cytosine-5-)-methyltransferase [Mycoplasma sp. NEAQ87857]